MLTRLTPKYLLDKTMGKDEQEKSLREIYELSLKTPGMPIPESEIVYIDAVAEGVKTGILGIRKTSEVYYKEESSPDIDSVVLRSELAKKLKEEKKVEEEKKEEEKVPPGIKPPIEGIPEGKERIVRKVTLRATIPWDKLSQIVTGVIRPLKDKGNPHRITIEIEADSEEGFDRTTLEIKVKETLNQIGATIEEWKEE